MTRTIALLLCSLALLVAGCGDDEGGGGSADTTTQAATTPEETTEAPAPSTTEDSPTTTEDSPTTTDDSEAAPAAGGAVAITMRDIKFDPREVTVKVGQQITWTNGESVPHNVVAQEGGTFESDTFGEGGTFQFTPEQPGKIEYVCTLHPGMDGEITVTE
jgi:plastocyanin